MDDVAPKLFEAPYVAHDAGVLADAVMLRPTAAVERLIPLHAESSPIAERAIEQHGIFVATLRELGVKLSVLEPALNTPGEALIGDIAVLLRGGAVVARPSTVERRVETVAVEGILEELGIPILGRIVAPGLLDATDVTIAGETAYVGVSRTSGGLRARSNSLGRAQFAALAKGVGLQVVELGMDPTVGRLRNVFSFVATDTVIVAPSKVDTAPLAALKLVEVPLGEEYAAGVLALGGRRVIANVRYRESLMQLGRAKIRVEAVDLWEFGKAGAGPFSLVLPVKRR